MGSAVESEQYIERGGSEPEATIIIPTVDDIRVNGYPRNEMGETYGPDVWESTIEPDLLLACNEFGQYGYVRQSDFNVVNTLEDAMNYEPREHSVNMYSHDGVTIVGVFTVVLE